MLWPLNKLYYNIYTRRGRLLLRYDVPFRRYKSLSGSSTKMIRVPYSQKTSSSRRAKYRLNFPIYSCKFELFFSQLDLDPFGEYSPRDLFGLLLICNFGLSLICNFGSPSQGMFSTRHSFLCLVYALYVDFV